MQSTMRQCAISVLKALGKKKHMHENIYMSYVFVIYKMVPFSPAAKRVLTAYSLTSECSQVVKETTVIF